MRVRLKHHRLAHELARSPLTLNRWAQKMGLGSGHLSELANGKRVYVRPLTREKLLKALDLQFDDLFEVEVAGSRPVRNRTTTQAPPSARGKSRASSRAPGRAQGRRKIGNASLSPVPTKGVRWMNSLIRDLTFAFQQVARRPGFAAVAILTLAVGIGSNTALFSLVNTVLWKPYPYKDPGALVRVYSTSERNPRSSVSFPDYLDLREQSTVLEEAAAHDWEPYGLSGGDEPVRVGGARVSASLFRLLGVEPLLGRTFGPDEDRPGGEKVVVLSERLWQSYFGADGEILGRTVHLNDVAHKVIGVMPILAEYPNDAQLWVPLARDSETSPRGSRWLHVTGRLKNGVGLDEARSQLAVIGKRLEEAYPQSNEKRSFAAVSLRENNVGPLRTVFLALLGLVGFVLLIVCANVANLLLARGLSREREMAIRSAMGAGRGVVVRQLLTESLILAASGGALGLVLGYWAVHQLLLLVPVELPPWVSFSMDFRLIGYTLAITAIATLVFGLFPALQSSRFDLTHTLREGGGHSNIGLSRHRFRRALVVAEVALSLVVLIGAGLVVQSVIRLSAVDPGFGTSGRLTVGMDMLAHLGKTNEERISIFERFQERLRGLPGVEAVGAIDRLPLKGSDSNISMSSQGQTYDEFRANPVPLVGRVNSSYFEAMGIPFVMGRTFEESASEGNFTVVISRKLSEGFWPDENAIGKRLRFGFSDSDDRGWMEVAGVVEDVHHIGIDRESRATIYVPYRRSPLSRMYWVIRTSGEGAAVAVSVRGAIAEIDSAQPLHEVMPLREVVRRSYWSWEFMGTVFQIFALVGLTLACVGIYGVMAYSVSERTQEMGVRLALGAGRGQLVRFVLKQGTSLIALGLVIGLPLALLVGKGLSSVLFQVEAFDLPTFGLVTLLLVVVALAAILLPARRASKVDPIIALRYE